MTTDLTISNLNIFLKGGEKSPVLKTSLSSLVKTSTKQDVKTQLFKLIKEFTSKIKVKHSMNDKDLISLVNLFYKDYYWFTVENLYGFFTWVLSGHGGDIYQTFDIPTFMKMVAKYQETIDWTSKTEDEDEPIEKLQLTSGKIVEPNFGAFAAKLDAKIHKRKVRLLLHGPKWFHLEGFCDCHGLEYSEMWKYFESVYGPVFDSNFMDGQVKRADYIVDDEAEKYRRGFIRTNINLWLKDVKEFEKSLIEKPF